MRQDGPWYCLTRYVPGQPAIRESLAQRRRRGRDLARLNVALRGLYQRIGQRPDWRPQHSAIAANTDIDWQACLRQLTVVSPRLGSWAQAAAGQTRAVLAAIGAGQLPTTVIHGDFAEWNVHPQNGGLAGVIDFGLTHQDSRPTSSPSCAPTAPPETALAYRGELARTGWPLSALEEAAITPIYHAFRLDMTAWELDHGLKTGQYNRSAEVGWLIGVGVAPMAVDVDRLAGDEHQRSDAPAEREKHPGVRIKMAIERTFATIHDEVYEITDLEWVALGMEHAVCRYRFSWTGVIDGQPRSGRGRGTNVVIRRDGEWRMLHEHLSS